MALLGWLAIHAGSRSRSEIASALWPDVADAAARNNMRTALWALRRAFGQYADALLDASRNRYALRFAPDQLPPVNAFWSLAMYELPSRLLVANPLNRYLINSPMLPDLKRDDDGGVTLYIQHDSPGKDKESNWLPAPSGPFLMFLRLFWPKPEALDGKWKQPPLQRAE